MPHVEYFVKCEGTSKGTTKRTFVRAEKINDTALTFITPGSVFVFLLIIAASEILNSYLTVQAWLLICLKYDLKG